MKRIIFIILTSILPLLNGNAQSNMLTVRYSTDNGLPSNTVYTTLKDSDGFIWIGTWYGLSSFDGTKFTPFVTKRNNKSDIPPRKVITMVEDKNNNIWIRTTDNRLYRFNKTTEQFNDMYSELKRVSKNLSVIKVQPINNGNTLIYTRDKSIFEVHDTDNGSPIVEKIYNAHKDIDHSTLKLKHNVIGETAKYLFWLGPNFQVQIVSKGKAIRGKSLLSQLPQTKYATSFVHKGNKAFIGTRNGEVITIDLRNGKTKRNILSSGQSVTTIAPTNSGFYATTSKALYKEDTRISTIAAQIETSFVDRQGNIWIYGLESGLTLINPKSYYTRSFPTPQLTTLDAVKFCDAGINGLFILLRNGKVWRYDYKSATMSSINPSNIVGTNEWALPNFTSIARQDISFYDINLDADGLLWLSSANDGLFKIRFPHKQFSYLYPTLLANDVSTTDNNFGIRSLYQGKGGKLWIGTRRGNLYNVDPRSGNVTKVIKNTFANVYHMMEDRQGNLWIASKGQGLFKGTPDASAPEGIRFTSYRHNAKDKYSLSDDRVYFTFQDSKGRIWVCTYGNGLNLMTSRNGHTIFINKNNELRNYPQNDLYRNVRQIVEDGKHTFWLATTDGLLAFDGDFKQPKDIIFNNFRHDDNPTVVDNDIYSILKDHNGKIWLSIFGSGLNKVDNYDIATGKLEITPLNDNGLQGSMVSTIVEDHKGRIWFSTENGLASISAQNMYIRTYGFIEGFLRSKIEDNATLCLADGRILIGSREGIICFNPDEVEREGKHIYPTFIVDFKVQNKSLNSFDPPISEISPKYAEEITLRHDQNMFSIEFATLKFIGKAKTAYTYILDGYEERWHINDDSRIASYANVPSGHYTFRVKPVDGESPERTLRITILPPWWLTWWAYCIYIILAGAALYGGIRIALTMLRMRNEVYINDKLAELKIRFFTNISHELRTPLTLIKTPIDSLRRHEKLSAEGKEFLNLIDRNATKMLHLVNQILDFRKVQNGKMPLHISHVNITEIISTICEEFRLAAKDRNITLNIPQTDDSAMVWCDAEKIGITISNLISNAFKYTDNGGKIDIGVTMNEGQETCTIKVEDNGAGIPEQQLSSIFERFSMADNTISTDTNQTGTGIGLSLAREYVNLHHGRIWAENAIGSGAVFFVEIPVEKGHFYKEETEIVFDDNTAKVEQSKPYPTVETPVKTETYPNNNAKDYPTLVLVEDNDDLRQMLKLQLSHSYNVITATDGEDGLNKIKEAHPDLIITDLMMPRMDGVELLKRIRSDFSVSHVPVIVLTAKNSDDDKMHTIASGANAFITKPFSYDMLLARITQLLKEQSIFQRKIILQSQCTTDNAPSTAEEYEKHLAKKDMEFIGRIHSIIEENMQDEEFNINTIAENIGLSRSAFFKKLKSLTGCAPVDLVREIRLSKAATLMTTTDMSVAEVAYAVGFKESSYFGKCFRKKYGMTPLEYRAQQNSRV